FDSIGVHRLEARAVVKNGRGNGVLQKLGARPEGSLAASFRRRDHFDRQFLWGLTADDCRQRMLLRRRVTEADPRAQLAAAIVNVEERLSAHKAAAASGRPLPYRFFVTNEIGSPPGGH